MIKIKTQKWKQQKERELWKTKILMNKNLFKIWWFITAILLIMLSIQIESFDLRGRENEQVQRFLFG